MQARKGRGANCRYVNASRIGIHLTKYHVEGQNYRRMILKRKFRTKYLVIDQSIYPWKGRLNQELEFWRSVKLRTRVTTILHIFDLSFAILSIGFVYSLHAGVYTRSNEKSYNSATKPSSVANQTHSFLTLFL